MAFTSTSGAAITAEVSGLGGPLCRATVDPRALVQELKEVIEAQTGIPAIQQRLFLDLEELPPARHLHSLAASGQEQGEALLLQLQLVRRPAEQAELLQALGQLSRREVLPWLQCQAQHVQENREVVLAAVQIDGWALRHVAVGFRADREVVLAAVTRDGGVLQLAATGLQGDREVVLAAVKEHGWALHSADISLQADREVVLAAVSKNGMALQFADPRLQADREVISAAAARQGVAPLQFADARLLADCEATAPWLCALLPRRLKWYCLSWWR